MNIRIVFGYLFFLLSIIFCAVQLVTLLAAEHLEAVPLILQFFSASVCLLLASLAAQSGHKTAKTVISVVAFSVCFLALLIGGIMAMRGTSEMAPIKYVIFLVYGGLYGFFGIAFSLLAGRSVNNEVTKDA
jgi:low temperature requirement protein LtrA